MKPLPWILSAVLLTLLVGRWDYTDSLIAENVKLKTENTELRKKLGSVEGAYRVVMCPVGWRYMAAQEIIEKRHGKVKRIWMRSCT